jgi:hypothetical protein
VEVWQNGNRTGCLSEAGAIIPGQVYQFVIHKTKDRSDPYEWSVAILEANAHSDIGHTLGTTPSRVNWARKTSNAGACGDFSAQPPGLTACVDLAPLTKTVAIQEYTEGVTGSQYSFSDVLVTYEVVKAADQQRMIVGLAAEPEASNPK